MNSSAASVMVLWGLSRCPSSETEPSLLQPEAAAFEIATRWCTVDVLEDLLRPAKCVGVDLPIYFFWWAHVAKRSVAS